MIYAIIILVFLLIISTWAIVNLLKKNEQYEVIKNTQEEEIKLYKQHITLLSDSITLADDRLKAIDLKGAYSSDDEIGWFFKQITSIQEQLNLFKVK